MNTQETAKLADLVAQGDRHAAQGTRALDEWIDELNGEEVALLTVNLDVVAERKNFPASGSCARRGGDRRRHTDLASLLPRHRPKNEITSSATETSSRSVISRGQVTETSGA
jgi:hypothetical protein